MKRPQFAPVWMLPKPVYLAVCAAYGRPFYAAFQIMQRVA